MVARQHRRDEPGGGTYGSPPWRPLEQGLVARDQARFRSTIEERPEVGVAEVRRRGAGRTGVAHGRKNEVRPNHRIEDTGGRSLRPRGQQPRHDYSGVNDVGAAHSARATRLAADSRRRQEPIAAWADSWPTLGPRPLTRSEARHYTAPRGTTHSAG